MSLTTSSRSRTRQPRAVPRLILAFALAVLACVVVAGQAAAGTHHGARVSGTYAVPEFGSTECAPLGAVHLRCRTTGLKSVYDGDLEGETTTNFEQIINCATGRTIGQGFETFAGTVRGGAAGTLTWRIFFAADFDCATFFPSNLRALGVITGATGGLAGLSGVLRFGDVTYDGVLR